MSGSICRKMTSSSEGTTEVSETPSPRAIVAGHGSFAEGLINAVHQICGNGGLFIGMSNSGLSGPDIEANFRERAVAAGIRVFFTDLPGGSATMAVRRIMRTDPHVFLVTGTNLPALLEFAFRADADPGDAARTAAEKGRAALTTHGGQ